MPDRSVVSPMRLVSSHRLIEERKHSGVSLRVIRVDQGRAAPDFFGDCFCKTVGLFYIAHEFECSSYQSTEGAPLACRRICWVYLPAPFILREGRATPMIFVRIIITGSFDDGPSKGL